MMMGATGCGGDPFEPTAGAGESDASADTPDGLITQQNDVAVAQQKDVVVTEHQEASSAPDHGSAVVPDARESSVPTGLCGELRVDDAPGYARELCVPGGTFQMGSNTSNLVGDFADHTPSHSVTLSSFVIDAYEVCVLRYRACVNDGSCTTPQAGVGSTFSMSNPASDDLPVTFVSWQEAQSFCEWDGNRSLPTEAQWEYVARGPSSTSFPWGNDFVCNRAVLGGYNGGPCVEYVGPLPQAVSASAQQGPLGQVYNLIGNVAEWVADNAGSYPSGAVTDPQGPSAGTEKLIRGGSWANTLPYGFGYARAVAPPDARGGWGFRCAHAAVPAH
jgi:formylglycine-generating enzyme required for sulfatase activity